MTTGNSADIKDGPIDEVQAEIDAVQAGNGDMAQGQYVTVTQFNEMKSALEEKSLHNENMLRGLQGRIDTDRATVQKNRETQVRQQHVSELEENLENIDPAMQMYAQSQIDREKEELMRLQKISTDNPVQDQMYTQPGQAGASANDGLDAARDYVKQHYLDPASPDVNYGLLFGPEDASIRSQRFMDHVFGLRQKTSGTPEAPIQEQQSTTPMLTSPPVGAAPAPGGSISTIDDLREQYLTGRMTSDQYRERAGQMGFQV